MKFIFLIFFMVLSCPVFANQIEIKPGSGITFQSEDKSYKLNASGRVQLQYVAFTDDDLNTPIDSQNILIRRARLKFTGHILTNTSYKVELRLSPKGMGYKDKVLTKSPVLDAYVQLNHFKQFRIRIGQDKIPFNRHRIISSSKLLMIERASSNNEFELGRDIGIQVRSDNTFEYIRYYVGLYQGRGTDDIIATELSSLGTVRVEILPLGNFNDYTESAIQDGMTPKISIGMATAYKTNSPDNPTSLHTTADILVRWTVINVLGELYAQHDRGESNSFGYGGFAQIGVLLTKLLGIDIEGAARYSVLRKSKQVALATLSTDQIKNEAGGGLNLYMAGHPYKIQADLFRKWDEDLFKGGNYFRVQIQTTF